MIITRTPLRISFLGGNTDLPEYYKKYGGMVLTTSIDKYVDCIVKERFDKLIVVNYSQRECVESVNDLKHGIVREALKMLGINHSIEISFMADIPGEGSGLGSSSAVAVGVLNALHAYLGKYASAQQLLMSAIKIELDALKKPIGVQDQCIVAMGGLRLVEFTPDGKLMSKKIEIQESTAIDFNNSLMLFYTGVTRKTDEILKGFDTEKNKEFLDRNKVLVLNGQTALKEGDLKHFGEILDEYWDLKKKANDKVTNPEIEKMYQTAKEAGAIGCKVLGAGGGGFMLVMFPANKRAKMKEAMHEYREMPFRFSDEGSKVLINI